MSRSVLVLGRPAFVHVHSILLQVAAVRKKATRASLLLLNKNVVVTAQ
jgi:hypothetical protein